MLLEKGRHPRAKPCGEGLLPHGVAALAEMGLAFPGHPVRGLRYVSPRGTIAEADFPAGCGMVVRRDRFDALLFDAAAATPNVTAFTGTAYDPQRWKAGWVVGADGLHSRFHGREGFRVARPRTERVGLSTHVAGLDVDPGRVEVIFHATGEVYLAPVGGGEALVSCLFRQDAVPPGPANEARVLDTLRSLPVASGASPRPLLHDSRARRGTARDLRRAGRGGSHAPRRRRVRRARSRGRRGDVARDPVGPGRRGRHRLGTSPRTTRTERRHLGEGASWVAAWILRASRHPRLADRVVAALSRRPDAFAALLGVVSGGRPRSDVSLADLLRLAA